MSEPTRFTVPVEFADDVYFSKSATLPPSSVTDQSVATGANVAHTKTQHRWRSLVQFPAGSDVTAKTQIAHIAYRDGGVLAVEAAMLTVPAGGDKTVTIDVQKSTGGGAFATILSTPLVLNSSSTVRTAIAAVLSGLPTLVDGDLLQVIVTVAGSTGTQAQGLTVAVVGYEDAIN